ncbi:MAG: hypothetical protein ACJ71M_17835, partial [Nitrososphaeraceae archaeon]
MGSRREKFFTLHYASHKENLPLTSSYFLLYLKPFINLPPPPSCYSGKAIDSFYKITHAKIGN